MEQNLENSVPLRSSKFQSLTTLMKAENAWDIPSNSIALHASSDASLFSSSLPVLRHEKLDFVDSLQGVQSTTDVSSKFRNSSNNVEETVSIDDINPQAIMVSLPDDEEALLSGIMDDFDPSGLPNQIDELDEYDLFGSVGGMELDDPTESITLNMTKATISDGFLSNGIIQYSLPNGIGTVSGEHPFGEHPSRTLFVRNINSNVEDSELHSLFEQYGDIRSLYTACKNRGFVMISYYDIRSARNAMRALQNRPLRRRKLDIHFSIPKDNPSDKDVNQGTLVIFNLDPSVSNDDLRHIFGAYGEVKEIRETPHKRHHKFIEFYDVRAAEAALRSLNKSDIAGKRIKLEPSRPGGARRNLMQQVTHDLEQDEIRSYRHHVGSPIINSPPGPWAQFSSSNNGSPLQIFSKSPSGGAMSPIGNNHVAGLASVLSPILSTSAKIAPIGKDQNKGGHSTQAIYVSSQLHGGGHNNSHSLPDHTHGLLNPSPGNLTSFGSSTPNVSGVGTLTGPQFLWGNSSSYKENTHSSSWQSQTIGNSYVPNGQGQGPSFPYQGRAGSLHGSSHSQHLNHVGSAPSVPFEKQYGFIPKLPETSFTNHVAFGNIGISRNDASFMNISPRVTMNQGMMPGNMPDNSSPNMRMLPAHRFGPLLFHNAAYPGLTSIGFDSFADWSRSRRMDNQGNQVDNNKQYQLDLDKIIKGEDTRTTIMIKNIPNKYTSKMLLGAIDETHKGTYDFLYLPIDFKNKCNVGYAFINMLSPAGIISFYKAFNGKKWEKFNSEKVASLAYARIQGRAALVAHFQNSSLMNEDKRCRPILFDSERTEAGDEKHIQLSNMHAPQGGKVGDSPENPEGSNPNGTSTYPELAWKDST
ncbi:protein MEI2-like 2 [Zingiber officinale]|uniref:protein MEI2-like 2 n=1 Tax=Zingiber officinale TaxID=94328 RepID=UPI001C4CD6B6|nr:protein MEI2-like 2 [Zingiber officinale]XP_042434788.1 protein MEI2-like 2 [Zingiber officinale]